MTDTTPDRPLPAPRPHPPAPAIERELGRAFADWCAPRRLTAIPAMPATVAALLASEADRELRPVTIARRAAAIAAAHRAQDHPNPRDSGAVAAVLSGIRRRLGTARTSESNRATGNAFYLSPSPTARNHWESGPSGGRTNQHDSEQAPLGSTAARPRRSPACDATKHLQM